MRILLCVKRDLEGCIALNHAIKTLESHKLSIVLSDRFTRLERSIAQSAAFIFYERDLLVRHLFPLIELAGSGETQSCLTFNQIQDKYEIPVMIADDINSLEWEAYIRDFDPDIVLSVRNDFIFKKNIINIPKLGIFNVHPGSLPEYRGVYAPFRAMFNKDKLAGCTLHKVDTGIDTGPVVGISTMPIDYSKSVLWHMCQLYPLGIDLFARMLSKYETEKTITTTAQDDTRKRYYTFPTAEEFSEFRQGGYKLIDHREYMDILELFKPSSAKDPAL